MASFMNFSPFTFFPFIAKKMKFFSTSLLLIEIPEMDDEIKQLLKNRKIQIEKT